MMWMMEGIYKEELTDVRNVAISEKDSDTLLWNSYFILVEMEWVKISSDLSLPQ